jgi:uncharacterized protein (DUF952 family)
MASSNPKHVDMNNSDRSPERIYHIATAIAWQEALQQESYVHPSLATEGFIHCSYQNQVAETLKLHFKGQTDLVLLEIDPSQLTAELKVEPSRNGELFPHLYGPLNLDAAIIQTAIVQSPPC